MPQELHSAVAIHSAPFIQLSMGPDWPTDIHVNPAGLIRENHVFLDGIKVTSNKTPHLGLQRSLRLAAATRPVRGYSLAGCACLK